MTIKIYIYVFLDIFVYLFAVAIDEEIGQGAAEQNYQQLAQEEKEVTDTVQHLACGGYKRKTGPRIQSSYIR